MLPMKVSLTEMLVTLMLAAVLVVPILMVLDREPPYVRESGSIIAANPKDCGLEDGSIPSGAIYPGSCVTAEWKIREVRKCPPNVRDNVTRSIRDGANVIHPITPVAGKFGTPQQQAEGITRYFRLPMGATDGPAEYRATATFACNLLQYVVFPIAISEPDIQFRIEPLPLVIPR